MLACIYQKKEVKAQYEKMQGHIELTNKFLYILILNYRMKPGVPRASIAKDLNVRSESEVVYPFGVQNDLGHVVLTRNAKVSKYTSTGIILLTTTVFYNM